MFLTHTYITSGWPVLYRYEQTCLNWRLITRPSECCVFIVASQTYLVAQITVEQISLNLTDEIHKFLS